MGGFQSGPSLKNEGDIGTKNNKETYICKRGSFGAAQVGKVEQMYIFEKGGLRSGPGRNSGVFIDCRPKMTLLPPREFCRHSLS